MSNIRQLLTQSYPIPKNLGSNEASYLDASSPPISGRLKLEDNPNRVSQKKLA